MNLDLGFWVGPDLNLYPQSGSSLPQPAGNWKAECFVGLGLGSAGQGAGLRGFYDDGIM